MYHWLLESCLHQKSSNRLVPLLRRDLQLIQMCATHGFDSPFPAEEALERAFFLRLFPDPAIGLSHGRLDLSPDAGRQLRKDRLVDIPHIHTRMTTSTCRGSHGMTTAAATAAGTSIAAGTGAALGVAALLSCRRRALHACTTNGQRA